MSYRRSVHSHFLPTWTKLASALARVRPAKEAADDCDIMIVADSVNLRTALTKELRAIAGDVSLHFVKSSDHVALEISRIRPKLVVLEGISGKVSTFELVAMLPLTLMPRVIFIVSNDLAPWLARAGLPYILFDPIRGNRLGEDLRRLLTPDVFKS